MTLDIISSSSIGQIKKGPHMASVPQFSHAGLLCCRLLVVREHLVWQNVEGRESLISFYVGADMQGGGVAT